MRAHTRKLSRVAGACSLYVVCWLHYVLRVCVVFVQERESELENGRVPTARANTKERRMKPNDGEHHIYKSGIMVFIANTYAHYDIVSSTLNAESVRKTFQEAVLHIRTKTPGAR